MGDVERLVRAARRSVVQLVARARGQISKGADADRVQDRYVARAFSKLEDVEAYAVLAPSGDTEALAAIERIVAELEALHEALSQEFPDQGDAHGDP